MLVQTGSLLGQTTSDAVGFSSAVFVPLVLFNQVISCFLFISMVTVFSGLFFRNLKYCIIRDK